MKILVTAGATREPLDAVRYLSNVSTGATGAALAAALAARGHTVTLLRGTGAVADARFRGATATFGSGADLSVQLRRHLATGKFGAVIMTAAVADYRPARVARGKLSSDPATLTLQLVRNPKLLPQLRSWAPRPLRVIGFKLTVGAGPRARSAAVAMQFARGAVDAVVHNDLAEICGAARHPFRLYRTAGGRPQKLAGVPALARALDALWAEDAP